jgi:hypothetical protein
MLDQTKQFRKAQHFETIVPNSKHARPVPFPIFVAAIQRNRTSVPTTSQCLSTLFGLKNVLANAKPPGSKSFGVVIFHGFAEKDCL